MSAINLVQMAFEMADRIAIDALLSEASAVERLPGRTTGVLHAFGCDGLDADEAVVWLKARGLADFSEETGTFTLKQYATCCGCGCTDTHACAQAPCWWFAVDYAAGTGVCSNCETHLDAWRAAFKVPAATQGQSRRVTVNELATAAWMSDDIEPHVQTEDAEAIVGLAMRRLGLFLIGKPGVDAACIDLENGYELHVTAKQDATATG